MFHPSAPTSLSLSDSFTLRYVTASSSATGFTPTMASSEDPLSITPTFLSRLGHGCRSYNQPGMQTALHRVRSRTFIAHLPPLPYRVTERISGFGSPRYLALPVKPTRGSHQVQVTNLAPASFRSLIGSISPFAPSSGRSMKFLRAPLLLPTYSLLSGVMTGLAPASS